MWNGTKVTPIGEAILDVFNQKTTKTHKVKFTVVQYSLTYLLGLITVKELGCTTINTDQIIFRMSTQNDTDVTGSHPTMQPSDDDKPGELGTAILYTSLDAKPKVLPCRKVPFALTQRVKDELEILVKRGILVPTKEPTHWVSQMTIVEKSKGSLHLCIDPRLLNESLQREHFKLPAFDDVLPAFNKAKIFTKQDIKEAFWHIKLDEESSKLTTMITPYGRFRWPRLPFGLNVSSEIFQRHLTQALEGLEGCINVADDIIVAGRVLQVDSSKDGLGAVVLQEGKPIEFASRALTEAEKKDGPRLKKKC
ncbi:hypothetical protein RRG08_054551 [Elysia crispata]|uniref:Reverse transcriptase domain-containing protein n=1 Tax=Elysia crispata TaxID=231223 RepID=A0AAE1E8K5_9GAST|nr:hypothetical protein RRG08_054551 [Elysia crispata]